MADLNNVLPALTEYDFPKKRGRPKAPQDLLEALERELSPQIRKEIALTLIDIALNAPRPQDRLMAVKEIYDRVEGKSLQRRELTRAENDPLIKVLNKVLDKEKAKKPKTVKGEYRELGQPE